MNKKQSFWALGELLHTSRLMKLNSNDWGFNIISVNVYICKNVSNLWLITTNMSQQISSSFKTWFTYMTNDSHCDDGRQCWAVASPSSLNGRNLAECNAFCQDPILGKEEEERVMMPHCNMDIIVDTIWTQGLIVTSIRVPRSHSRYINISMGYIKRCASTKRTESKLE